MLEKTGEVLLTLTNRTLTKNTKRLTLWCQLNWIKATRFKNLSCSEQFKAEELQRRDEIVVQGVRNVSERYERGHVFSSWQLVFFYWENKHGFVWTTASSILLARKKAYFSWTWKNSEQKLRRNSKLFNQTISCGIRGIAERLLTYLCLPFGLQDRIFGLKRNEKSGLNSAFAQHFCSAALALPNSVDENVLLDCLEAGILTLPRDQAQLLVGSIDAVAIRVSNKSTETFLLKRIQQALNLAE